MACVAQVGARISNLEGGKGKTQKEDKGKRKEQPPTVIVKQEGMTEAELLLRSYAVLLCHFGQLIWNVAVQRPIGN